MARRNVWQPKPVWSYGRETRTLHCWRASYGRRERFNKGSVDVKVTERFNLSKDQTQLAYQLTVVDPLTFTEPATSERLHVALGAPFLILDCTVS